jgi:hypothetical protein
MKSWASVRIAISLLVLAAAVADEPSNVLTVCASGCAFRSVQAAVDRARPGDVVELKAGERFVENVVIGLGKSRITLRTSRAKQLPGEGYRIRPAEDAAFLATLVAPGTEPALRIGGEGNVVVQNGVDVASGRLRFEYMPPNLSVGEGLAVSCINQLPAPLVKGRQYWVRDWDASARSGRLAETKGGPAIRLTDTGKAGDANYYQRPACAWWDQPRDISVVGLRMESTAGKPIYNLAQVGSNSESDPVRMGPSQIRFEHMVLTGHPDDLMGPLTCLALFGGHQISVSDSWIGHCKRQDGYESKGVAIQNVSGAKITNNYISAASINLLTAGVDSASGDVNRDLVITGNFFEKQGYMMYKEGVGTPTGACYYGGGNGAYYRRTDVTPNTSANGASYTCQPNGTWALAPQAVYRNKTYLTKNLMELKDCENCLIQGNMMRGSYAGPDGGQGWCFGISVTIGLGGGGGHHRAHNVTFRDNHADYCFSGIVVSNSAYNETFRQVPLRHVVVENNLLTNFGWFPAMSQFPQEDAVNRYGLHQSGGGQDISIVNNTIRGRKEGSFVGVGMHTGSYKPDRMSNYQLANNLFHYRKYALFLDARGSNCSPEGLGSLIDYQGAKRVRNNVFYAGELDQTFLEDRDCTASVASKNFTMADDKAVGFVSDTDSRLKDTSPFSAANSKAKALSDDSSSLGADVDLIEQYTIPALKGVPPAPVLIGLEVKVAARQAELSYRRPENVAACQVSVYSGPRLPKALVPDTASAANQEDGRASSTVQGRDVRFLAGAVTPLVPGRPYGYQIQCGQARIIGRFETLAEGTLQVPGPVAKPR